MDDNTTFSPAEEISRGNAGSPATYEQQIGVTVVIAILGIWSVFGNLLTILAITTRRYMRTKTNVFILSLAISDFLSALIASPLWLYRRTWGFNSWQLGQFACTLFWFVDESTSYCTAMHIASFAIWRFSLIRWPYRMAATKIRTIIIWVAILWTISLIFGGFIYSSFFKSIPKVGDGAVYSHWPMCSLNFFDNGIAKFRIYHSTTISIFVFLPMLILILTSLMIVRELYTEKTRNKSELRKVKEKRAVMQLAMIATSFMVGYFPMATYMMWTVRTSNKDRMVDYWTGICAYLMLRLSECMNPIAYNVSSEKLRKASMEILKSMCFFRSRKDRLRTKSPAPTSSNFTSSKP